MSAAARSRAGAARRKPRRGNRTTPRTVNAAPRPPAPRSRESGAVSGAALIAEAEKARATAYAPYSKFSVGAALLTRGGRIVYGCNVENASFGLSICAERNAVWKAVSEGERDFLAVAVTAGPDGGASPCGACRQVLQEFAPGIVVYWRDEDGRLTESTIGELLSRPFVWPRKGKR